MRDYLDLPSCCSYFHDLLEVKSKALSCIKKNLDVIASHADLNYVKVKDII
jgi:hypothetical protein